MKIIEITEEMRLRAEKEAIKREKYITHHYIADRVSVRHNNITGFLGEFCASVLLGYEWDKFIRKSYEVSDGYDILSKGKKIDVKTNSIPEPYFTKLMMRTLTDEDNYSKLLIVEDQLPKLNKCDYVLWITINREAGIDYEANSLAIVRGYLPVKYILENYEPEYKLGSIKIEKGDLKIPQDDLLIYPDVTKHISEENNLEEGSV